MTIKSIDRRIPTTTDSPHLPIKTRREYSIELLDPVSVQQILLGAMEYVRSRSFTGEVRQEGNVLIVDVPFNDTGVVENLIKEIEKS